MPLQKIVNDNYVYNENNLCLGNIPPGLPACLPPSLCLHRFPFITTTESPLHNVSVHMYFLVTFPRQCHRSDLEEVAGPPCDVGSSMSNLRESWLCSRNADYNKTRNFTSLVNNNLFNNK